MPGSIKRRRLVTVGIVAVLSALSAAVPLTLPAWRRGVREGAAAREDHTRQVLEGLAAAVLRYRAEQGEPPPTGDERSTLVVYLDGDPSNGGPDRPYYAFEAADLLGVEFLDLWREPYRYRRIDLGFEVWSTAGGGTSRSRHVRVRRATPSGE